MTIILSSFKARIEVTERTMIVEAMTAANGSVAKAAEISGLHPFQFRRILNRYNLKHLIIHRPKWGNQEWKALC